MSDQHTEQALARILGIKKNRLVSLRRTHLARGTDWEVQGAVVCYTPAGVQKLRDLAARPVAPGDAANAGSVDDADAETEALAATEQAIPELLELVVLRICPNPSLVICQHGETEVRVRVRTNLNFVPGMRLPARQPRNAGDAWFHEGRLPRFKGRY